MVVDAELVRKALQDAIEEVKHLPMQHDQKKHGRVRNVSKYGISGIEIDRDAYILTSIFDPKKLFDNFTSMIFIPEMGQVVIGPTHAGSIDAAEEFYGKRFYDENPDAEDVDHTVRFGITLDSKGNHIIITALDDAAASNKKGRVDEEKARENIRAALRRMKDVGFPSSVQVIVKKNIADWGKVIARVNIKHLPMQHDQQSHAGESDLDQYSIGGDLVFAGGDLRVYRVKSLPADVSVLKQTMFMYSLKSKKVYFSPSAEFHISMSDAIGENIDDNVRFFVDRNGTLIASVYQAGVDSNDFDDHDQEKAIKNIYRAFDVLADLGLSADTSVSMDTLTGEVSTTLKSFVEKHLPGRHDQREHGRIKRHNIKIVGDGSSQKKALVRKLIKKLGPAREAIKVVEVESDKTMNRLDERVAGRRFGPGLIAVRGSLPEPQFSMTFFHEVGHEVEGAYPSLADKFHKKYSGSEDYEFVKEKVLDRYRMADRELINLDSEIFAEAYSLGISGFFFDNFFLSETGDRREKHLPGGHDQQRHAGESPASEEVRVDRRDDPNSWGILKIQRPTDEDLLDAYVIPGIVDRIDVVSSLDEDGDTHIKVVAWQDSKFRDGVTFAPSIIMERHFQLSGDTLEPIVIHNSFELPKEDRMKGIGADVLERSEALYKKMGVTSVKLLANSTVGKYAWARMGFDFADYAVQQQVRTGFERYLFDKKVPKIEWPNLDDPTSWQIAAWKHNGASGKDFFLNYSSEWTAVKSLKDTSEGYRIGQLYYRLRKEIVGKHLARQHDQKTHGRFRKVTDEEISDWENDKSLTSRSMDKKFAVSVLAEATNVVRDKGHVQAAAVVVSVRDFFIKKVLEEKRVVGKFLEIESITVAPFNNKRSKTRVPGYGTRMMYEIAKSLPRGYSFVLRSTPDSVKFYEALGMTRADKVHHVFYFSSEDVRKFITKYEDSRRAKSMNDMNLDLADDIDWVLIEGPRPGG